MRTVFLRAAAMTALACTASHAAGDVKPARTQMDGAPAESVLWVGNSFFFSNNGLDRYVSHLAHAASAKMRGVLVAIGGSGIDWHDLDGYLRPGSKMGWYSFMPGNKIRINPPGRQFDTVVIMDCSQCPIHPQLKDIFHEYAKKDAGIARKYGVRPVFFMSWAYEDKPEMTGALAQAYTQEGNADDALVIPAGLAFAKALDRRPALALFQPDKRHPSNLGSYLAACVSLPALTGRSPVGNPYTAGIDADTAAFLQAIAWETVQEYYGKAQPRAAQ